MILICNEDVGAALQKACEHDTDNDAVHLARAAKIVRRDMLKLKQDFSGSFGAQCQEKNFTFVTSFHGIVWPQHYNPLLCLNQLSPSHSYLCTTVSYARGRLPLQVGLPRP